MNPKNTIFVILWEVLKKPFLFALSFCRNLRTSYKLMSKLERVSLFLLLFAALSLSGFKFYKIYLESTVVAAADGGAYEEAVVGEIKYLNPVLAQNDAEKSISRLLFSSLVHVENGEIKPEVSSRYEVSGDGKTYIFYLRNDIKFSDGQPLTSADVSYTIDVIKAPETKSPLYKSWRDVQTAVIDESTISFTLPNAYGPFIYNCGFGILPAHIGSSELSHKPVGSGMYVFDKSKEAENKISQIELVKNANYSDRTPFIDKIMLKIYPESDKAVKAFESDEKVYGLSGAHSQAGQDLSYRSSKRLALIFNLRDAQMKDKELRKAIVDGTKITESKKLNLTTLDAPLQREKAEALKVRLKEQNIELEISYQNSVKLQDSIIARSYQILLYGFDFGYDRDPYTFWHSSQIDQLNFAGWSDKASDILLEDARMLTENDKRNAKYDQFFDIIKSEYLAVFYDPINYSFALKPAVMGAGAVSGTQPYSRYEKIADWYIKEKRIKK